MISFDELEVLLKNETKKGNHYVSYGIRLNKNYPIDAFIMKCIDRDRQLGTKLVDSFRQAMYEHYRKKMKSENSSN